MIGHVIGDKEREAQTRELDQFHLEKAGRVTSNTHIGL